MEDTQFADKLAEIPDDMLAAFALRSMSAMTYEKDEDGAPLNPAPDSVWSLLRRCFDAYIENPQVRTSINDMVGRLTGEGFGASSQDFELHTYIKDIWTDQRNRLPIMWRKYVTRAKAEGELFLVFTVHEDGFVEVDFREPTSVMGAGKNGQGIVFHPRKPQIPLFYEFQTENDAGIMETEQIPSIFVARYPELMDLIKKSPHYNANKMSGAKYRGRNAKKFDELSGFQQFVVSWDMAPILARNTSQTRTTLKWVNHYENLKLYEIDHKKASGAYMWTYKFTDPRAFREWMSMSEADMRKTGVMAKMTPGGRLFLPPGMELEVKNPQLPKISDTDTDIMQMIVSGMNAPDDMVNGSNSGTYAAVKASRGPMSDRVSDETSVFRNYLIYDFFDNLFWLKSIMTPTFKYVRKVRRAVDFKKQKPIFKVVDVKACELVDISFPTSEVADMESRARGLLGVKHGSLNASLGIPNDVIARKMGFGDYRTLRLAQATEAEDMPELQPEVDQTGTTQEANQEKKVGSGEAKKQDAAPVVKRKVPSK